MRYLLTFTLVSLAVASPDGRLWRSSDELPLAFESHGGQFVSRGPGYSLTVCPDGAALQLRSAPLRLRLAGAQPGAQMVPGGILPARIHYLLGRGGGETAALYQRVEARTVYPGIDLVFHGNHQRLEYDFHLAGGRSADAITLLFEGAQTVRIDSAGDLLIAADGVEIRQPRPEAYQVVAGRRRPVPVAYRLDEGRRVRFTLGAHDAARALVIDPQLLFDTPFGGSGQSAAVAVALDRQGYIYVAGNTTSENFGRTGGVQTKPGSAVLSASADGGQTWTSPAFGGASVVNWVAAAPGAPSHLYAATDAGVFASIDGGVTWTAPGSQGLTSTAQELAVDAGSPSTVYATTGTGLYLSTDGAATWNPANNGIGAMAAYAAPTLLAIFAHPERPGTVFVMTLNPTHLYRSTDGAKSWTPLTYADPYNVPSPIAMAFVPGAPDTLFLGQNGSSVLESTDGGNTWSEAMKQSIATNQGLAVDPADPSTLYAANAAGVEKSANGGQTWTTVLPSGILGAYDLIRVALDPKNPRVVYALGAGGLFRSADAGATWNHLPLPYTPSPTMLFLGADSRVFAGTSSQGDVFLTKWSPDGGQLVYSTYLGGGGTDLVTGMALDSAGNVYLTGTTSSTDFPVTGGAFQKALAGTSNAFVAKIAADGSRLVYSTLLGGGRESAGRIAVDASGSAVVTGQTQGGFPVTPGAYQTASPAVCTAPGTNGGFNYPVSGDAYVAKLAPDGGSLVYATLLGGNCGETGHAVALDAAGNAWVVGATSSTDFPVTPDALQAAYGGGYSDGFVARFDSQGRLLYSTFLGGRSYDEIYDLTLDGGGNLYLTGSSSGFSQPASPNAFQPSPTGGCLVIGIGPSFYNPQGNAFVMKLDAGGRGVTGLTYIGSPCSQHAETIALDRTGSPWIAGSLSATEFPTAAPLQVNVGSGFVSRFSPDLTQLLFSTYFDSVNGLTLDATGTAYIAGRTAVQKAYLARLDAAPPAVQLDGVKSYGNTLAGTDPGIAPGKVMRVMGRNLGPATATPGVITSSGLLATTVAGVTVTFDGIVAPLLSVGASQIQCVTPFALAGHSQTTVQVTVNGTQSNAVLMPVTTVAPEVLAVLNPDFTLNSAANPAPAGSLLTIYASGLGQTNPPSVDGQVNYPPLAQPVRPVAVGSSRDYDIAFAGAAYGAAAGIMQISFRAPDQSTNNVHLNVDANYAYFDVHVK